MYNIKVVLLMYKFFVAEYAIKNIVGIFNLLNAV